jgi:hypothetical protein
MARTQSSQQESKIKVSRQSIKPQSFSLFRIQSIKHAEQF